MKTEIGAAVRIAGSAVIASLAAAGMVACSSGIHATIDSRDGADMYQQTPHRETEGAFRPDAVRVGRLSYREAVVVVCYLHAARAYQVAVDGRAGYIDADVDVVLSDGTPIHPPNVNDC